jgi:hypothetical protein
MTSIGAFDTILSRAMSSRPLAPLRGSQVLTRPVCSLSLPVGCRRDRLLPTSWLADIRANTPLHARRAGRGRRRRNYRRSRRAEATVFYPREHSRHPRGSARSAMVRHTSHSCRVLRTVFTGHMTKSQTRVNAHSCSATLRGSFRLHTDAALLIPEASRSTSVTLARSWLSSSRRSSARTCSSVSRPSSRRSQPASSALLARRTLSVRRS